MATTAADTTATEEALNTARDYRRYWRTLFLAARLAYIWAEAWLLVLGATTVTALTTGPVRWLLVAPLIAAAVWRTAPAQAKNIADTYQLIYTSPAHWERFCRAAKLAVKLDGRYHYPRHRTTVGPIHFHPHWGNPRRWSRPESVTHTILPHPSQGDAIRGQIEAAMRTFYDYPSVSSVLEGNWIASTVTLDDLPLTLTLEDQ